jgi:site-specific DNA recombinase
MMTTLDRMTLSDVESLDLSDFDLTPIAPESNLCVVYLRISADKRNDASGVERQKRLCIERARLLGWTIVAFYCDNDISAHSGKVRPDYERMLFDLSTGAAQAILTFASDRLTRRFRDLVDLTDFLDTYKIAVHTITGGEIDLTSAGGRMKARMLGTVAAYESELRSERVKAKMDELAEAGLFSGGTRPFGYERDGVTIREVEAQAVRDWAADILDGKSLAQICRDAKEAGIKSAQGKDWHPSTVRNILVAPRTAGLRQHRGETIGEAVWEPLLDNGVWMNVKAILTDPTRKHRQKVSYLLTGFLFAPDGTPLRGGTSTKYGKMRRIYESRGAKPRNSKIDVAKVEEAVEVALLGRSDTTSFIKPRTKPVEVDTSEVEQAQAELDLIESERKAGRLDLPGYLALRPEYVAKLDAAKAKVAESAPLPGPAPKVYQWLSKPGALRKAWEAGELDFDAKREVLSYALDGIEVGPGTGRVFNPERLRFRWKV